jgi:transcriptional regulator of acetoin/glycerol metabolism
MKELALSADQAAFVTEAEMIESLRLPLPTLTDDEALMSMSLAEAKRRVANDFERRYLLRLMVRAQGSVSEGARLAGLDRTNFRRLLQRHDLR